jgi:ubiquinol-cytochrome c reductase iron-sulfur subunit
MSEDGVDLRRRRFLTATTAVVGAIGGTFAAVPFVSSLLPSEKAKALGAPVQIDISKIEPGMLHRDEWRGKLIMVVRRTADNLKALIDIESKLADPESARETQQPSYAKNRTRSLKDEYLVMVGLCTHLGCAPTYRPEVAPDDLGPDWQGGFYCPCHGSRFDLAGRVYKSVPAPSNMVVPPYRYISDSLIEIGVDHEEA